MAFIFPYFSIYFGNFIIPADEHIFFRGVGIPPTSNCPTRCRQGSQTAQERLQSELEEVEVSPGRDWGMVDRIQKLDICIHIYIHYIYIYMYAYIHIVIHPSKMGFNHHVGELIEINIMGVPQKWI